MKRFILLAASFSLIQCSTEPVYRVPATKMTHRTKFEGKGEFVGFADGRAFKCAKPMAWFPWSPKKAIWWCYESELSAEERNHLLQSKETR